MDPHMHLTNFSVNKNDKNFVRTAQGNESISNSKWSLRFLLQYLEENGIDSIKVMSDIESITTATILSGMMEVKSFHTRYVIHRHTCYELYGIDVLLDETLKPHIIEINISPSLNSTNSELDFNLKFPLMLDVLRMVRIVDCNAKLMNPCPAIGILDKEYRKSLSGGRRRLVETKSVNPWDSPVFADFVIIRDFLEEKQLLGGFHRLYPKRKTASVYSLILGSLQYEDLVLADWLSKTPRARFLAIRTNLDKYVEVIDRIRGTAEVETKSSPRGPRG
jgi:tubulin polyglutamylase TTLL4